MTTEPVTVWFDDEITHVTLTPYQEKALKRLGKNITVITDRASLDLIEDALKQGTKYVQTDK
jgi:hypothetical protein